MPRRSSTAQLLLFSSALAGGIGVACKPTAHESSQDAGAISVATEPGTTASATVSVDRLRAHVRYLASDDLEGRGAATSGIDLAARYLESQLIEIGARPAFGQAYRQPFEIQVGVDRGKDNSIEAEGKPLALERDFVPYPFSATSTATGAVVFAGFGIRAPELHYDDYAGLDAKGKIVVVLPGEPGERDDNSPFEGKKLTRHSSLRGKVLLAREAGAKAILVVEPKLRFSSRHTAESDAGIIAFNITPQVAKRLLGFDVATLRAQIDASHRPHSRSGTRGPIRVQASIERMRKINENIAGVLGPEGAEEAVVLGAHYDHLGFGGASSLSGTEEPQIHNGADDNASGTSAVLEAARALAKDQASLGRKVIFVLFAGEESGLIGSHYFVAHAPHPKEKIVAMINLDMVGRMKNDTLQILGAKSGKELQEIAERVLKTHGLVGAFAGGAYGPSDHTSFYAEKIPVMFLFTGAHEDYHKPSDDTDRLDYPGLARASAVAADLVRTIARRPTRPSYVEVSEPRPSGQGRGYGPSFGSIPEFGAEVEGVLLAGVKKGSPAGKAGVQKGDVIVKFGGVTVKNLVDFTEALRSHAPGDEVEVVLRRGKDIVTVQAVLERRDG